MEKEQNIYLRKNGENLSDPDIIALCKLEQNRDIIENTRLGSYDNFGNYVFLPDIRFELINIPKFIYHFSETQDKKVFDLKTIIPIFGELFFTLTISQNEAVLYLVETVTRELGNYVEVYEEVIDALALGKMNALKTENIFAIFHIYENDDDQNQQNEAFFIFEYQNILVRKIYLSLLSKELVEATQEEESDVFAEMIAFLKDGGDYGKKVLDTFMLRLKERPEIFEIDSSEKYKKAINEVLLSALDISTTPQDKENFPTKEVYLKVLNARNKDVEKQLENAHKKIDKDYVLTVATSAVKDHNLSKLTQSEKIKDSSQQVKKESPELASNRNVVREFYDRLILKKTLTKSAVKQKAISNLDAKKTQSPATEIVDKVAFSLAKKPIAATTSAAKTILPASSQTLKGALMQKAPAKSPSSSPKPNSAKKVVKAPSKAAPKPKAKVASKPKAAVSVKSKPKIATKPMPKPSPKIIAKQPELSKPSIAKSAPSFSKPAIKKPEVAKKKEEKAKSAPSFIPKTQKSEEKQSPLFTRFSELGVVGAPYSSHKSSTQTSSLSKENSPIETPDAKEKIIPAQKPISPTPSIRHAQTAPQQPQVLPITTTIQARADKFSSRSTYEEQNFYLQAGKNPTFGENQLKTPIKSLSEQEQNLKESTISEELSKNQSQNPASEQEFNLTH